MNKSIGNALASGIYWLMDDLTIIRSNKTDYIDGKAVCTGSKKFCCKGVLSNFEQQEYKQGFVARDSIKCTILACTLNIKPCLGDKILVQGCSPFAGQVFTISDKAETSFGAAPAIKMDSLGTVYTIELVK